MNTEQQDKLWNELSEESKRIIIKEFEYSKIAIDSDEKNREAHIGACATLDTLFGSHNLNPKPQIKTWEDVKKEYPKYFKKQNAPNPMLLSTNELRDKLAKKVLAMYKIAILIESRYGGMVSEEEWNDGNIPKYSLLPIEWMGKDFEVVEVHCKQQMNFISFHTRQQAKEFMSHESNKKLVEQYYMM